MLKPGLQLALGQQLTMTPQLQHAIRLLQLPARELELEVRAALESNVMLEADGDRAWDDVAGAGDDASAADASRVNLADGADHQYMSAGSPGPGRAPSSGTGERELESVAAAPLRDHLLWQLEMGPLGRRDLAIGVALIEALDGNGYLADDLEAIRLSLQPDVDADIDEIEAVLHYVQMLDPPGIGARDLAGCLHLQLRQFDPATAGLELAKRLIDAHLDELAGDRYAPIARSLGVSVAAITEAAALVRALDPRPGGALAPTPDQFITPDVIVSQHGADWSVELNSAVAPRLRVNDYYVSLLRSARELRGNEMMRNDLREARWLIRSLDMRHQTLLNVAGALVEHQRAFLERGAEYMRPLILKDIAHRLDIHESTVSRVTANKYMQTPLGVIAFGSLFSNPLPATEGSQRSATAIRALISKMIAREDPAKPLSDGAIADQLAAEKIRVARRTVAKYREALDIPARAVRRHRASVKARGIESNPVHVV